MAIQNPLWDKLRTGEIDANNQQLFLSILLKGLIFNLNKDISVRGIGVPHYILNTGDDIAYLDLKGQNQSIEPLEVSNENFVYSVIPRCLVQPTGLNILTDELSNPYTYGTFTFEYDDVMYNFTAQYRRMPVKVGISLKYVFDTFTDALEATQQMLTKLAFIDTFTVVYLGQTINCSYMIPSDVNTEYQAEFDGLDQDSKTRSINLDIEVETNLPVIWRKTIMPSDAYIKEMIINNVLEGTDVQHVHDSVTTPAEQAGVSSDGSTYAYGINVYPKGQIPNK